MHTPTTTAHALDTTAHACSCPQGGQAHSWEAGMSDQLGEADLQTGSGRWLSWRRWRPCAAAWAGGAGRTALLQLRLPGQLTHRQPVMLGQDTSKCRGRLTHMRCKLIRTPHFSRFAAVLRTCSERLREKPLLPAHCVGAAGTLPRHPAALKADILGLNALMQSLALPKTGQCADWC